MKKLISENGVCAYFSKISLKMKLSTFLLIVFVFQIQAKASYGQNIKISLEMKQVTIKSVLNEIELKTDFKFLYEKNIFDANKMVSMSVKNEKLLSVLNTLFEDSKVAIVFLEKQIIIKPFVEKKEQNQVKVAIEQHDVKGTVRDAESGAPLAGVNVVVKGTTKGVTTDSDGKYSINAAVGNVLIFSYLGHIAQEVTVGGDIVNVSLKNDTKDLDTVVVTGIRASQQKALNIKRVSTEFVDAITSVDAGKLPDKNIAEALQRVSGIAIQRNRGQGDFVSIRGLGPEFVRGSINGRTLVSASESFNSTISGGAQKSTGRETNFDVLPSEMIESIEVFKTGAAEHVEGGIGGVVNIKTAKPIKLGNKYAISPRGEDNTFRKKIGGDFSAMASLVNKKRNLGALFNLNYSDRKIREDIAEGFGYAPEGLFGAPNSFDTTGDGKSDFTNVFFPFSSNSESFNENRKRITLNSSLQWAISAKTNLVFDFVYSKRDLFHTTTQQIFLTQPLGSYFGTLPTNADGSKTWTGLVVSPSNTASNYSINSLDVSPVYDEQKATDNIYNTGLNLTHKSNGWDLNFDAAYGKAKGDFNFKRAVFAANGVMPIDVKLTPDFIVASPKSLASLDVNNFHTRNTEITDRENSDIEYSLKGDALKEVNSSFISSIKFGVRYSNREKDIFQRGGTVDKNASGVSVQLPASSVPHAPGTDNFIGGAYPLSYSNIIFPSQIDALYSQLINAGAVKTDIYNPNQSFNVKEATLGGYVQANLKGTLGDIPFTGNAGFRLINTNVDVTSFTQAFRIDIVGGIGVPTLTGNITEVKKSSSYSNFLPAINLKFEASKNVFFRLAFSKSLTRPLFSDLGGLSANTTQLLVNKYGNADLKPYESTNFDVGAEWYIPGGGLFSTNFFYKKLSSFVTNVTKNNVTFLGIQYRSFSQPENQLGGNILGSEISYQQPLKFLPGFLKGLGIITNFTLSDGKLNLNSGQPAPLPGISRYSVNSALYYDNGGVFQARVAYTYRDKFLLMSSDVFGQEIWQNDYGQVDASLNFEIKKGINIFVDATNLNNEKSKTFSSSTSSPAYDKSMSRPKISLHIYT